MISRRIQGQKKGVDSSEKRKKVGRLYQNLRDDTTRLCLVHFLMGEWGEGRVLSNRGGGGEKKR